MAQTKAQPRPKNPASKAKGDGATRRSIDWDAVERDYRTAKFTVRELAEKHGVSHQAISKRSISKEWTQDLALQIKQATNARLVADLVDKEVASGGHAVANTVLVAAEVNKQVILGHRQDLTSLRASAQSLLHELTVASLLAEDQEILSQVLAGSGAEPLDEARARAAVQKALSLPGRVSSIKSLVDSFDKLHLGERRAFGIADETTPDPQDKPQKRVVLEFIDAKVK